MIYYALTVTCISAFLTCEPLPREAWSQHVTSKHCDKQLLVVAKSWKPSTGAYSFRCLRVNAGRLK
jgi:hypothetical protein